MVPLRFLLNHSRPSKLLQFSACSFNPSLHTHALVVSHHKHLRHFESDRCQPSPCGEGFMYSHPLPNHSPSSSFHTSRQRLQSDSSPQPPQSEKDKMALLSSQMNMRLLNENSFLSWCRNAYLSSVVGIAMIGEATTSLGQTAGFGAFLVGGMNLVWGTSCHVTNLVRLRHATGMSGLTLSLNILGSMLHCCLWLFLLLCYIGFLDDPEFQNKKKKKKERENSEEQEREDLD